MIRAYPGALPVVLAMALAVGCTATVQTGGKGKDSQPDEREESQGLQPDPGEPIIVIPTGPEYHGENTYEWYLGGKEPGHKRTCETWNITDPADGHFCELRDDFVGDRIDHFKLEKQTTGNVVATHAQFTGVGYRIHMKNVGNRMIWQFEKKVDDDWKLMCANVIPVASYDSAKLPAEFCDKFKKSDLLEVPTGTVGKRLDFTPYFYE